MDKHPKKILIYHETGIKGNINFCKVLYRFWATYQNHFFYNGCQFLTNRHQKCIKNHTHFTQSILLKKNILFSSI
jgi:hypothetical protein